MFNPTVPTMCVHQTNDEKHTQHDECACVACGSFAFRAAGQTLKALLSLAEGARPATPRQMAVPQAGPGAAWWASTCTSDPSSLRKAQQR